MSDGFTGFILLLCSGIFSGSEAVLFTLANRSADQHSHWIGTLLKDKVGSLSLVLFANLAINLTWFAWAAGLAKTLPAQQAGLVALLAVATLVIVGDILPKMWGSHRPYGWARYWLIPLWVLHQLFGRPARAFGKRWVVPNPKRTPLAGEDFTVLLHREGLQLMAEEERGLIHHLLEMATLRAGALRRPLDRVFQLPASMSLLQARKEMKQAGKGWAAVREEQDITGILDLSRQPVGETVADAMQSVPILPELAPIASGVPLLRDCGSPFVLLVDEFGQAAGIIERGRWADTLLDRLPEEDFFEVPLIQHLSEYRWRVSARLPLHEFRDQWGDPGKVDPRIDTLGGLVEEKLGRIPEVGDEISWTGESADFQVQVRQCHGPRPVELDLWVQESAKEKNS